MEWFVRSFIKASLVWLGLAVTLGLSMAARPAWVVYRTAHLHMALLGFVTMMIFGVAYHVIPRFTGHPIHSRRLATMHWWMANAGLAILVVGFIARVHGPAGALPVVAAGGILAATGAYLFIYNLWRTIDGQSAPRAAAVPLTRG